MSSTFVTTDPDVNQADADGALEIVKANLYFVLSRAFASPLVMKPDDPVRLRQIVTELPCTLQEAACSLAETWEQGLIHPQDLSLAYARLFLGPFEILASPYASFYLQPDQQLMGPVSQSVASIYSEAGLEPGPGPREAPDHVALEWEFMYFVTHQYLVTGEDQWLQKRQAFVATHLRRWMPSLTKAMKQAKEHTFYDSLAAFLSDLFKEPASL